MSDTVKGCQFIQYALDTAFEVSKLISLSPKQAAQFHKLKAELSPILVQVFVFYVQLDGL